MEKINRHINQHDERSKFANAVCKLLVQANGRSISAAVSNLKPIYDHFEIHIRNIYELIDTEIPLFKLYELRKQGAAENKGLTKYELHGMIGDAREACEKFYRKL